MAKSSIHFENTDASFAQKHNSRKEEPTYLLEKRYWQGNEFEEKITTAELKNLYAQQCQIRRERHARGATPTLKDSQTEAVINLTSKHTLDDVKKVAAEIEKRYGLTPVSFALHRDEGHMESRNGKAFPVYNYHAHVVFFTMKDGISMKRRLNSKVFEDCNTLTAELLGMERGESKTDRWQRVADRLGVEVEELKRHKDETPQQYIDRCAQIAESKGIEHFNIYEEVKPRKRLSAKEFRQVAKEKAVLSSEIEVKTQELKELQHERDLQVFKANLNHFLQEGEITYEHDSYDQSYSHDDYSHESFKDGINRESSDCVCVPRLSECSLASSGQSPDLSLYATTSEGVHRHQLRDGDPVFRLLSKTTFVTQTGTLTTLKQLSQLKSELRKAFIAEQGHTQEDYKQLNKAFEDLRKRFKTGAKMTPEDVVKSVNAWIDLGAESEQLQQEKADLTSKIEVKTAEIEQLKTELQAKKELTDDEIEQLPKVQELRTQHQEDIEQIQKLKDANRQLVQSKKSSYTQRIEIIKSATEDELKEHSEVYQRLQTRLNNLIKTAKTGFMKIMSLFGMSKSDETYLKYSADVSYVADKAVETVENNVNAKKLQEEHTQHRSFHR